MAKKPKAKSKATQGTELPAAATGNPSVRPSKKPFFLVSFCKNSYHKLGPNAKIGFWGLVIGLVLAAAALWLAFGGATKEGQEATLRALETLMDTKSKADSPELEKRFPGGFTLFGVLKSKIIRSSMSYSIDMIWDSATISELTPSSLTMQLQNVKITRTETTPTGAQPAGALIINGKVIWQIDRRTKLVSINNAISVWGYVIGGFVLYDTNDVLIVALGLQKVE